ncbi:MAG: nuclear transport factor 2 family protein [Flavobacteriaceae bacterium]|nr:nuclear transport factor 2 family protein [Flavobacteriaceae bacterium]
MKTNFMSIFLLAFLVLLSCKEATTSESETETTETETTAAPDYASFDTQVNTIRALFKAHEDEDMDAIAGMISDSLVWSPPVFNDYEFYGKAEFLATLKDYQDNYENIKYTEGVVTKDSVVGGYFSGSVFPEATASSVPDVLRIYGTWTGTHTASQKNVGMKFYSLATFDEEGKIDSYSSYFDTASLIPKEE